MLSLTLKRIDLLIQYIDTLKRIDLLIQYIDTLKRIDLLIECIDIYTMTSPTPNKCRFINACVKGHLEPTHLKSTPLFTFSTKSLGQDSPSIHHFFKIIESRFTTTKIKLGEDSPSCFVFSRLRFTFKQKKNKTTKRTFVQDSPCFKYY